MPRFGSYAARPCLRSSSRTLDAGIWVGLWLFLSEWMGISHNPSPIESLLWLRGYIRAVRAIDYTVLLAGLVVSTALAHPIGWADAGLDASLPGQLGTAHAQPDQRPFVTTWKTDTANQTIAFLLYGDGLTVTWGDGASSHVVGRVAHHIYPDPGTYTVSIHGSLGSISLDNNPDAHSLMSIEQWVGQDGFGLPRRLQHGLPGDRRPRPEPRHRHVQHVPRRRLLQRRHIIMGCLLGH